MHYVLWELTIQQAFLMYVNGVELHTGKKVDHTPDRAAFHKSEARQLDAQK